MIMMNIFLGRVMQVMKKPALLFFLIVIPLLFTFFLGGLMEKGQQELAIPVAFVDEDESVQSKLVIERIHQRKHLQLVKMTRELAEKKLLQNEIDSVFIIKQGFEEQLNEGNREKVIEIWQSPTSMASGIVREVIASEVLRLTSNYKAADDVVRLLQINKVELSGRNVREEAYQFTDQQWSPKPLMTIHYMSFLGESQVNIEDDKEQSFYNPYLGLWTFFTMIMVFISFEWIVQEKKTLFSRIRTTYSGFSSYLFQSMFAYILLHWLQVLLTYKTLVHLEKISSNSWSLCMMGYYILCCVVISFWIASVTNQLSHYYLLSFLFTFVISILGGSFFPVNEISELLNRISTWLPQGLVLHLSLTEERLIQLMTMLAVSLGLVIHGMYRMRVVK